MADMKGKIVVVTGASGGVGKETARGLAALGAKIVIVGRGESKLRAVAAEIGRDVEVLAADIGVVAECRRVAAEVEKRFGRVDVLVHNAASIPLTRKVTADGFEEAFAVNTVAPYVLTTALAPLLQKSAPARVIFLVGQSAPMPLDDVDFAKSSYNGWTAYQRTKHASLLVLRVLAQRFAGTGVTVNGAFPGIVGTPGMADVIKAAPLGTKIMLTLMLPFMRKPAKGAASSVWTASAPELANETGKLWSIEKPLGMPIKGIDDDAAAKRMIDLLDARLGARQQPQ